MNKKAQKAMVYNQMIENNESITARSLGEREQGSQKA